MIYRLYGNAAVGGPGPGQSPLATSAGGVALEAGQRIRDFILEEKIGAGGAGEVWRARHQHLDNSRCD